MKPFKRSRRQTSVRTMSALRARLLLHPLEDRWVPATFTVTNTNDAGPGSLRQALLDAAALPGDDVIEFDSVTGTIVLTSGELLAGAGGGVTINGPGSSLLTIQQTKAGSRVLNINNNSTDADTYLVKGLTLTGGNVTGTGTADRGGGIGIASENVTLLDVVVRGNTAAAGGGGIGSTTTAANTFLTLIDSVVADNLVTGSGSDGGGIRWTTNQQLTITRSTISGNTASDDGGGIYAYKAGKLVVSQSTISHNRAIGADGSGGGVSVSNVASGPVSFTNTTIVNNYAAENGGGVRFTPTFASLTDVQFNFCTITGNIAEAIGGGIVRESNLSTAAVFLLKSTVVANNQAVFSPDAHFPAANTLGVDQAAIGHPEGWSISAFSPGVLAVAPGTPLVLGIPSQHGGGTLTQRLVPGSPLVDQGGNPSDPVVDQTGSPRIQGAAADVGALEFVGTAPVAVRAKPLASIDKPGGTSYAVTISYHDETGVSVASIDATDLIVTGKPGATVSVGSISSAVDAKEITVTYVITPPGGTWDSADNGNWSIEVAPGAVQDVTAVPVVRGLVGVVPVQLGNIYTVTKTTSSGTGSLAQAITDALAATPGLTDLIRFDPVLFSTPQTITLPGTITINDFLYIAGPGKDLLTVRAAPSSRHFVLTDTLSTAKLLTLEGMTFRDAAPASGFGGSIRMVSEFLTLRDMRFTGNQASNVGGVIGMDTTIGGRITAINTEFSNNLSLGVNSHGAVIGTAASADNVVIIRESLFRNNVSAGGGGAIYSLSGPLYVENTLFVGNAQTNSTSANGGGGALFLASPAPPPDSARTIRIVNSTLSSNTAVSTLSGAAGGGAILFSSDFGGNVVIENCTITKNSAGVQGGAIARNTTGGTLRIVNTILEANAAPTGPDVLGTFASQHTLISNSSGAGYTDLGGTLVDVAAKLTPLYDFGGVQSGHATLPGSPARDSGTASSLPFDQRGPGFPRTLGVVDRGALEFAVTSPVATISPLPDVTAPGTSYSFTVTYYDDVAIDKSSVNGDEIQVTGPGGFDVLASVVSAAGTDTQYDVTYKFTPPGGFWNSADNGPYFVRLLGAKVQDKAGNPLPNIGFGGFNVGLPADITVTTDADSGPGSLRQALTDANAQAGAAVISFDPTFFAVPRTITLTSGELLVANDITLNGPGPNLVTISGNQASRIFQVFNSGKLITFSANGVTLRDGRIHQANLRGGAIFNNGENVLLTNVHLLNNQASGNGGAIGSQDGNVTLIDCVGAGNRATGAGADGGFLFANVAGTIALTRTTISGNSSFDAGGAFYLGGAVTLSLESSTLHSNVTGGTNTASGGAIYLAAGVGMTANNSTISGNTASRFGGGIRFNNGPVTLNNSTVAYNISLNQGGTNTGGGIYRAAAGTGLLTLNNSVVAQNSVVGGGGGGDVQIGSGLLDAFHSVIFDPSGWALGAGSLAVPPGTPVLLGPLANHGGPTLTHLPAPGSPLRDAGPLAPPPAVDQRGVARPIGTQLDVGAVESDGSTPVGLLTPLVDVTSVGGTNYQFTVTYYDDTGINPASIGVANMQVTGPGGGAVPVVAVTQTAVPGGIEATYTIDAPGGLWDNADAGIYSIALKGSQVKDVGGNFVAAASLGSFRVQLAKTYVVTNTLDSGPGSLRQAVLEANAIQGTDGADSIIFDPVLFSTPQTITLSLDHLSITDSVTITGPGAKLLTINTSGLNRHFMIYGPNTLAVNIADLTLTGGKLTGTDAADAGGSIYIRDETVKLSRVAITNNSSSVNGGALTVIQTGATVTIEDALIAGSSGNNGGGIRIAEGGIGLNIRNSTLSGNSAATGGGAISNNGGVLALQNSTLAGNTASGLTTGGGGLRHIAGTAKLESTLVAANSASKGPDISADLAITADFSLIGISTESKASGTGLLLDVDPLLGPLANHGGLTLTHALGSGSPAIDAGSNPLALDYDQRGIGFPREFNGKADIGAYERQSPSLPTVTSIVVNGGNPQRSRLTSITVNFSFALNAATLTGLGAITLTRTAATPVGSVGTLVQTGATGANGRILVSPASGSVSSVTLTFDNANGSPETAGVEYASLSDGRWQLAIPALGYSSPLSDPNLRRLFGDSEPNGLVDSVDFAAFGSVFGTSGPIGFSLFDYDNNGVIDSLDFSAFGARFGLSL